MNLVSQIQILVKYYNYLGIICNPKFRKKKFSCIIPTDILEFAVAKFYLNLTFI